MTRPEEQEIQIVDPDYDLPTDLLSALQTLEDVDVAVHDAAQEHRDNHDTVIDCAHPGSETRHGSLVSRVEETQFDLLEPETQTDDELGTKPPHTQRLLELVGTGPSGETSEALPFVTSIRLPKDLDAADGFKWSKAIKPVSGQFSARPPGRSVNLNSNPDTLVVSNQPPVLQAPPIVQLLPSQSKLLNEDRHLLIQISEANSVGNHENEGGPSANSLKIPQSGVKDRRGELQEHLQQSEAIPAIDTPVQKSRPVLDQSSAKQNHILGLEQALTPKSNARPANKSHKRLGMSKQPFPEVEELSRSRRMKGNIPVVYKSAEVPASLTDGFVHVDIPFPDTLPNHGTTQSSRASVVNREKDTSGHHQVHANIQGCRPSPWSFSRNDLDDPQIDGQDISSYCDGQGVEVDRGLSHPTTSYQGDKNRNRLQRPSRPQQIMLDHQQTDIRERLLLGDHDEHYSTNFEHPPPSQRLSRPPSQSHSRPQSTRSNVAKTLTRPFKTKDSHAQRDSAPCNIHSMNATKVKKTKCRHSPVNHRIPSDVAAVDWEQTTTDAMAVCLSVRQEVDILERIAKERDVQKGVLELQQQEISKLNSSSIEFQNQIQRLEGEKLALTAKINKLMEISSKYKTHMNGVVNAQKHLLAESSKIQKESANVQAEFKALLEEQVNREAQISKLQRLIDEAKAFREPIEKMQELSKEHEACKIQVDNLSRTNDMLNADLQNRVAEIGRERYSAGQIRRGLYEQIAAQKESVETLKKTNTGLWDNIIKEDGLLASVLSSKDAINIKLDDKLSDLISLLNDRDQQLAPAWAKLLEDHYTRIENKLQATDHNDSVQTQSNTKFLEDLKHQISQVRLDQDTKDSLNESIAQLRDANSTLALRLNVQEFECQGMVKQIEELGKEIATYRDQLTAKSSELAALCALQEDNAIQRSMVDDLEIANAVLQSKLDTINQESLKAKEEVDSSRMAVSTAREQAQELRVRFADAQSQINTLTGESKKYAANSKAEIEKARQEVAKSAHTSQTEMKIHHDALVKNLEQRRSEVETQLRIEHEQLQKCNEENACSKSHITNLQQELEAYKDRLARQGSHIKHLDQQKPSLADYERRESSLQHALTEVSKLKLHVEDIQNKAAQKLMDALGRQKGLENNIANVEVLEEEKRRLDVEKSIIQKRYDTFNAGVTLYLKQNGTLHDGDSAYDWITGIPTHASQNMGPPGGPLQKLVVTRQPSSANSCLPRSSYGSGDEEAFGLRLSGSGESRRQRNTTDSPKITTTTVESFDQSPYQPVSKPLRAANRKSSNFVPPYMQQPRGEISTKSLPITSSSSITVPSGGIENLSFQKPTDERSMPTRTDIDSSPLSDIDRLIIDQIESYNSVEELEGAYECSDILKDEDSSSGTNAARGASLEALVANTTSGLKRVEVSLGHRFFGEGDRPSSKPKTQTVPPPVPSTSEESARRRQSIPLKSALKKGYQEPTSNTFNTVEREDIDKASSAKITGPGPGIPGAQKRALSRFINNNQQRAQTRNSTVGSPYHRIASGGRPVDANSRPAVPPAQHQQITPSQASLNTKSSPLPPLMSAPQRNARKRTVSALAEAEPRSTKSAKAPRLCRNPQIKRNVIPDSQEIYRY